MGKPRQTRSDKWRKRPCVMKYREWADLARFSVLSQVGTLPPADSITHMRMVAYFEPPKSLSKSQRLAMLGTLHRVKPDGDNIIKCQDALFEQDSAIPSGSYEKRWDRTARLEITIEYEAKANVAVAALSLAA